MYGQTEATARIAFLPPTELERHAGSVGIPIARSSIEIRRPGGTRADTAEIGDVCVSGPNVMLGYWHAPEATAAVITDDARGRWLKTGDLGFLDEEGFLYLVGRSAEMIKVGGHRVHPEEIEDAVRGLDGVEDAGVCAIPNGSLGDAILLVLVRRPGCSVTARQVLAHCRTTLSPHKFPKHVMFSPSLPRTSSGKLQRTRLARLVGAEARWAS